MPDILPVSLQNKLWYCKSAVRKQRKQIIFLFEVYTMPGVLVNARRCFILIEFRKGLI